MSGIVDLIRQLVHQKIADSNCFLVDVSANGRFTKVQVYVDCYDGMTIDKCASIHRHIWKALDEQGLVEKLSIDVSSPGMSSAFKVRAQYEKNVNRVIIVQHTDGRKIEGILKAVEEEQITLDEYLPLKPSKRKAAPAVLPTKRVVIPFNQIKSTKKKVTF